VEEELHPANPLIEVKKDGRAAFKFERPRSPIFLCPLGHAKEKGERREKGKGGDKVAGQPCHGRPAIQRNPQKNPTPFVPHSNMSPICPFKRAKIKSTFHFFLF
jgi:hypothetical protein